MPIFNNMLAGAAGQTTGGGVTPSAYQIERSLRFNPGDSSYLSFQPSSAGNRKTWTWAGWVKRSAVSTSAFQNLFSANNSFPGIRFNNVDQLELFEYSGSYVWRALTNAVFRDPSAWYHICFLYDTTQATAADRIKLYVNNQIQTYSSVSYPSQNRDGGINSNVEHTIGCSFNNATANEFFNGYLADVHFIDGQALAPTDFGEYDSNSVWQPKDTSGLTFGTNGFHLDFSDNSSNAALGFDQKETVTLNPDGGMDVVTYTGNGSTQTISGLGFQPDFVWIKNRDATYGHIITDSVRGNTKLLFSYDATGESTVTNAITGFTSDGFTLGAYAPVNVSGNSHVAWCWKAGGAAALNENGSINSQVSVSTDYGFSIVSYTGNGNNGATIGHSLGATPAFVIVKNRDAARSWNVYHQSYNASTDIALVLDGTDVTAGTKWRGDLFSSTVFGVRNVTQLNTSGQKYIAYCWSEVSGFSKFGSYTGNGSTQSITFGFKPKYVLIKRTDAAQDWYVFDSERVSGTAENLIRPNTSAADDTAFDYFSFDSNGITLTQGNSLNGSGRSYVYAAFADRPGNNFDVNNLSVAAGADNDSLVDSPTNGTQTDTGAGGEVVGNYATLNPLANGATLSNGNLDCTGPSSGYGGAIGTIGLDSEKYYWEYTITNNYVGAAICGISAKTVAPFSSLNNASEVYYQNNYVVTNGTTTSGLQTITVGDVIGISWDGSNRQVKFYRNNSLQTTVTASDVGTYFPAFGGIVDNTASLNFGQRPFTYTPPTGYKSLCTANLTDPTIADGSTAMDAKLYAGNGSTQTISGLNFSPDLVWVKCRVGTRNHVLSDIIRGTNNVLASNTTSAEVSPAVNGQVSAFNSDGFAVAAGSSDALETNNLNDTYVAWTWDGGSSTVSNTDGSITSSVRANASAGFSIVTYTGNGSSGATVGHGLNAAPGWFTIACRNTTNYWDTWHSGYYVAGSKNYMRMNSTGAAGYAADMFQTPTSSVVTLGTSTSMNGSNNTYVMYCWTPVEGYSAFGSYTGNGSTDGPFVYTGFRPRWIMIKKSTATGSWAIIDAVRGTYNITTGGLFAESPNNEDTRGFLDILSNGFKVTSTIGDVNQSGQTHIVAAFAEHPFKTARAR